MHSGVAISRSTAYRFMRIAEHFNAEIAKRYGPDKLEAALRYLQTTPVDEQPGDLLAAEIRIRDQSGRFETVALHDATATQIREAIALLRDAKRAGQRIPTKIRQRAERLIEALPPPPKGTTRGDRVRLTRGKDGNLAVSFHGIRLEDPKSRTQVQSHTTVETRVAGGHRATRRAAMTPQNTHLAHCHAEMKCLPAPGGAIAGAVHAPRHRAG